MTRAERVMNNQNHDMRPVGFRNNSKIRRAMKDAAKIDARRNLGVAEPVRPKVVRAEYSPPGFFRRGALQGVFYGSHIGRNYL